MIGIYGHLFLGVVLGLAIAMYFWASREEKIEKEIEINQKIYSTPKLDKTMEIIVDKIKNKINQVKRELTEEEKNEIIEMCLKQNFIINEDNY